MRKRILLAALILCILLPAGCGMQPQRPPSGDTELSASRPQSDTELDSLRSGIAGSNCMLGIGFFGYIDNEDDAAAVQEYVTDSALAKAYPFLRTCERVLAEGAELYALVPANQDIAVTVYRAEISEDGTYIDHKAVPVYKGKAGEIVVLRCNISEVCANVLLSVTDGQNTLEFHPMISMESGCLVQERGCYDFSLYGGEKEISVETARERLMETDEVKNALEQGMKLLYTGDTQTIEGQRCLLFALGTDQGDQLVREQLYAVSDHQIYVFYTETDSWQVLGVG